MQVYAFIGKTGTGKSYRAQSIAFKYGIKYIIDDAILIKDHKVIEGKSAKTEATKIASVKAAIFMDEEKRLKMINTLNREKPQKILILGTSDDMVDRIVEKLMLEKIDKRIYIEDVASQEEIADARKSRYEDGKHVVPVPTFEIKEQFSGYFMDPIKIFEIFSKQSDRDISEKTVIRPTFSLLGNYTISERVINSIIYYVVNRLDGVSRVLRVSTQKYIDGMKLEIDLEIRFGVNIPKLSGLVKNTIIYAIDNATGINIFGININIKGISK